MPNVTKQELHVFRGTYAECMQQQTEDLEVYLAWDTQEIFVGNKHGVKVKYGGTRGLQSELEKYFSKFRSEVYSDVDLYIQSHVASDVEENIKAFDTRYANEFSNIRKDLSSQISSVTKSIENVNLSLSSTRTSLAELSDNVDKYKTQSDADISQLKSYNASNNTKLSELTDRVVSLENRSDLPQYSSATSGKVLSVDNNGNLQWVKMSGGVVSKETYTTRLLVRSNFSDSYEVSSSPVSSEVMFGAENDSPSGAVDGVVRLYYDGTLLDSFLADNNTKSKTKTYDKRISIDRSTESTHTISVTANTLRASDEIEYKVTSTTKRISIYVPCFVTVNGTAVAPVGESVNSSNRFRSFSNKEYTFNVVKGDTLKLYTTKEFSEISMSGFAFTGYEESNENYVINGVSCRYYVYTIKPTDSQITSMTLSIKM